MAQTPINQQALAAAFESAQQRKSFYFEPASRVQMVDKIEHLSRFSDFLLVVTGDAGAGKSTLLEQLRVPETDTTLCASILRCDQPVNVSVLLRSLAKQLPVDIPDQADNRKLLALIYEACNVLSAQGMQWLVMVDDAEKLGKDALEFLLHLLTDAAALSAKPHVILFGLPELMTRLQQDHSIDQLDGQTHHQMLEPFAEDEAQSYIIQRYKAAQSLSEEQLRQLFVISGGLPGGLNQAVENLFRAGEISQNKSSRGLPRVHLISIATVLIGVLLISLWQYWPEEQQSEDVRERVQLELPVTPAAKEAAIIDVSDEPAVRKILPIPSLEPDLVIKDNSVVEANKPVPVAKIVEKKAVEKKQPAKPVSDTSVLVKSEQSKLSKTDSADKSKPVLPKPEASVQSKIVAEAKDKVAAKVIAEKPAVKPVEVAAAVKNTVSEAPAKPDVKVKPIIKPVVKPVVKTVPKAVVKESPAVAKLTAPQLTVSEQALLEWPTSGYTLQVLGAGLKKSADDFIRGQQEPQKFYLFRTTYKGNPWYVVVYGQYKSRQSASVASKSLPDGLRKLQPWARSIQGIQSEIKK
ncbi:AAA family ATPase [Aliamphritea ceti]|uniref:AAA family ATPase n=1 Tax=Aliamphritea ceti TaxID=1524258 RepID=UPI0021C4920B|nr:AAA family ATPase [Aliamphritea ceti]